MNYQESGREVREGKVTANHQTNCCYILLVITSHVFLNFHLQKFYNTLIAEEEI